MKKHIKFDFPRMLESVRKAYRGAGPVVGVQIARNWKWRWYNRVEIDGPSVVVFDTQKRLMDGTTLRILTDAPLRCYDNRGELVDEWD